MRKPLFLPGLVLSFAIALLAGCSDDSTDPDPVTVEDLVGSWTASSMIFSNTDGDEVNPVALGAELRVTVLTGGRARNWFTWGDIDDEWDALLSISGSTLTATPAEASRPTRSFSFTLDGSSLTLVDPNSEFDFSLTGATPEPAREEIVYVRQ